MATLNPILQLQDGDSLTESLQWANIGISIQAAATSNDNLNKLYIVIPTKE